MSRRVLRALLALALLLTFYVGSYLYLSRRGFAEADAMHCAGFYFITPAPGLGWERRNYACVYLYWPLIRADCWFGTGREPGHAPLWGIQK